MTAASGVDALVHAVEAYLSNFDTPITDALAVKAMNLIVHALPKAFAPPNNLQAREDMATGSLLAGLAFGNAGVGAVHALAYPLGGRYHLANGVTNALLLPFVMEWNKLACVERFRGIAVAFHEPVAGLSDDAAAHAVIQRMHKLCADVEIPSGLRSFDISESAISELPAEAIKVERLLRNNSRVLTLERYKQGKAAMNSIFGGSGSFRWGTNTGLLLLPIVSLVEPILGIALALTLFIQGYVSVRIGIMEARSQRDLGIAGIIAAMLVIKGATWAFGVGILLCALIYGKRFFSGEVDKTFVKDWDEAAQPVADSEPAVPLRK